MDIPPKLRIMCSYGGHIIPRPRTKSLCYAGGETRIVSLNPTSVTNISSLVSHLSSSLKITTPFALKYQLPNHDLDSLISVLTDEDLLILLEELQRLDSSTASRSVSSSSSSSSSSHQSRIRLFVFAAARSAMSSEAKEEEEQKSAPPQPSSMMQHPKTEAWFHDALKGAKIMQKGRNCGGLGFEGEAVGGLGGEESAGNGNSVGSTVAETMMLETTSSFGSTSSSASLTNLAPVKSNIDDAGIGLQDSIGKLNTSDAVTSEYSASATATYLQSDAYNYKDPANPIFVTSMDAKVPNRPELENRESGVTMQMHNTVMQQQKVQYIQVESPYMSHNPTGLMPMSSFYPYYHTQLPQQQMMQYQYQSNQPQPVYLYPVTPTQTYSLPGYPGFVENPTMTSSQAPLHANTSYMAPTVLQTNPMQIDVLPVTPQVYNNAHSAIPIVAAPVSHVAYTENKQLGLSEKPHQAQSVADTFREPVKDSNELDDDLARVQIYKSQPPPPSCHSQYDTVTKTTEVLLSEALDQLHTDSLKQQPQ